MKTKTKLGFIVFTLMSFTVFAEEGGSGHYMPGSMSSFVDGVPARETFIVRYNLLYYNGSVGGSVPLPIGGRTTLGASATIWGHGLTCLWRPPLDWGDRWSYALSATVPFLWADVSANVTSGPLTGHRSSSVNGLGDIVLMPLMLNYNVNSNLNANFRVGIYAPTGDYEVGRLANTGKNFWTFEPTLGLMYFGVNNGREASVFLGADFNTENPDTHYQSGDQFHLDGTLAQHFPLAGGLAGVGVNGFWYDQITGDSGSGANFGDFEARTTGVGPVGSYVFKIGKVDMIAELKWLYELDTTKRLEGDIVWFKLVAKF
ncbi:MAG: transporter [Limisphaerales bacterium]